ncbi:MAG: hypothetical protein KF895_03165 [Parvibaculum sp.]|nr:hypothetical protein [Parvibaculum sp.]
MADEILAKKTIRIGQHDLDIVERTQILPVYADIFTEVRVAQGNMILSLAAICADAGNPPEARVVLRVRMPLETALNIGSAVDHAIKAAEEASDATKKAAN